jgi:8-amino-7-oxononanoate synthase
MTLNFDNISPWRREIDELISRGLYRAMPEVRGLPGSTICVNGRKALNFSGNNYLGLAGHPDVIQGAVEWAVRHGAGSTASRLIAGNTEAHEEMESFVRSWKETEAALVFASGYHANVGILTSLMGRDDLIISDQLNHASIIDGCRLSRARVEVYPHVDLDRVEELLRSGTYRRRLVVTESVFSMDGDFAPLRELDALCKRWGAALMVDEAHATGVLGPQGRGLASEYGIFPEIQMGTLGKAVGSAGAYVAGSFSLIQLLVNRARSLIYTTAPPPSVMGAALAGLKIIASEDGDRRRARLKQSADRFFDLLDEQRRPASGPGHIVPVLIGLSSRTMEISAHCLENGVFAHGIRFPTVPDGTARLRFTLMSDHTEADIHKAAAVLKQALGS